MGSDILEMLMVYLDDEEEALMHWIGGGKAQDLVAYKQACAKVEMIRQTRDRIKEIEEKILAE